MTRICFTGYSRNTIEVHSDGRVIAEMDVAKFCGLDYDLQCVAEKAMDTPGAMVQVPTQTAARGLRPKNSRVHGILQ